MSQSKWLVAAVVPGVERQPPKKPDADEEALLKLLHRWRNEAGQAGGEFKRIGQALRSMPHSPMSFSASDGPNPWCKVGRNWG